MDSQDVQEVLMDLLDSLINGYDIDNNSFAEFNGAYIRTFEEASLLTRDNGIVINFKDGSEFNIIISQTGRAR